MSITYGNSTIFFGNILLIIVIGVLLFRWGKQLETDRLKVFYYFLTSTVDTKIGSFAVNRNHYGIWIPVGFIFVCWYLFGAKKYHPAKMKASILGGCIAIYSIVSKYIG